MPAGADPDDRCLGRIVTPDLIKLLCARYPLIFPDGHLPPRSEPGNGWFGLLDALCEGLQGVAERGGPQVIAYQVNESFGRLHFEPRQWRVNAEQHGMIDNANAMSARTCEVCGAPGLLIAIRRGGCRTRCATHEARRTDEPIPVLYVHVDIETGHVTGQVAGEVLSAVNLSSLMVQVREKGYCDPQVIQVRGLDELP
jgi:hypothetical protein